MTKHAKLGPHTIRVRDPYAKVFHLHSELATTSPKLLELFRLSLYKGGLSYKAPIDVNQLAAIM
jgi:hypothetical protein